MTGDRLHTLTRTRLEAIQAAVDAILSLAEGGFLADPLESELYAFKDRLNAILES